VIQRSACGRDQSVREEAAGATSLIEAVLALVFRKFSNLLLMSLKKVNTNKALASYGMDSMITRRVPIMVLECIQGRCSVIRYFEFDKSLANFGRHGGDGDFRKIAIDEKKRCGRCCVVRVRVWIMHFYR